MSAEARRQLTGVFVCCLLLSLRGNGQEIRVVDDAKLPRFEVASVKPGDPRANSASIGVPPGRFSQQDMDLFSALTLAFGVGPYQLGPLPDVARQRFTIEARMPAGAPREDLPLMVRALLVDRFKLRYHVDRKEEDGYVLVMASTGRLGPQLRRSAIDCPARRAAIAQNQPVPALPAGASECGIRNGPGVVSFGGVPIQVLVSMLSNQLRKPVVDRTGLAGAFDVDLHFSLASVGPPRADGEPAASNDAPGIFDALTEQLGLKLTTGKAPVDRLTIDHIEPPDPD